MILESSLGNFRNLHEEGYWKMCKTFILVEKLGAEHLTVFLWTLY